ncbi:MAG: DUF1192 domain-containing protein [Hyphomicrobiaceae bacterium]|jgi:uncharacterized small protein (DUF1192 family)
MDWDEARPRPARTITVGDDLTALSVEDLAARITALQAEIARTNDELATKAARKSAADALFRK